MLKLNLRTILKARGIIYPFKYLVNEGITSRAASDLLNNKSGTVKIKNIEIICRLLHCTPNDIFSWSPSKNYDLPNTHPLQKLKEKDIDFDLKETIKTIPLDQLAEIVKIFKEHDNQTSG